MKEIVYYTQLLLSFLLSFYLFNHYTNVMVIMINIDSIHNLFVYILKNIYIYGRSCPKFLFEIGDRIKSFNQNIHLYEYNKDIYVRYIYYLLLYITNINVNYIFYGYGKYWIDLVTISLTVPYVSKNLVYPNTYEIYKNIDDICYIMICKIIAAFLNFVASSLFKIEPKIDYDEIKPYIKSSQKYFYMKKFIGSLLFSLILIYIEKIGFIYSTKFIKNIYQQEIVRKNKQESIENIFVHRQWDKLINPIVLNDFYFVYNRLNDIEYPIEIQIQEAISFIIRKFLEIYYLKQLSMFINIRMCMPFILFMFYKFRPYVFFITSLISLYNNFYGLIVFELIYYIKPNTIITMKDDIIKYIHKKEFLYIDYSIYYILIVTLFIYPFSDTVSFVILFVLCNTFYELVHKNFYDKILPSDSISYHKHKILSFIIITFGYLSNYNLIHLLLMPIIMNIYCYFIWKNARYKQEKDIIHYRQDYF